MKLHAPRLIVLALFFVFLVGCDSRDSERAAAGTRPRGQGTVRLESASLRDIRARADEAFARSKSRSSRFQTRIGPQPWPRDLPRHWPQPTRAVVVADSRRHDAERLLLVDLPGSHASEFKAYVDALVQNGFEIDAIGRDGIHGSLRVIGHEAEANLLFFTHANHTRLEILFRPN